MKISTRPPPPRCCRPRPPPASPDGGAAPPNRVPRCVPRHWTAELQGPRPRCGGTRRSLATSPRVSTQIRNVGLLRVQLLAGRASAWALHPPAFLARRDRMAFRGFENSSGRIRRELHCGHGLRIGREGAGIEGHRRRNDGSRSPGRRGFLPIRLAQPCRLGFSRLVAGAGHPGRSGRRERRPPLRLRASARSRFQLSAAQLRRLYAASSDPRSAPM
jgi:hypothetical protein